MAISAGTLHSLALKSDGTVVAWGDDNYGELDMPAGLNGVKAISASRTLGAAPSFYSLALKSDGTVVGWGTDAGTGAATPPAGLTDVVAISAGTLHGLALKSDGTVVAWGYDSAGQVDVPAGLTNVVAISAGGAHSLALQCAPTNQAPVAADDSYSVNQDAVLTVAAPGVLANDTDADGDPLTAVKVSDPAHGTLALNADGSFTYTPANGYAGSDSFTYKANDGQADSDVATVSIDVTFAWSGFFQPVDNLPTMNQVKAGSSIPVKFSLSGNQGLGILAAGYPASQRVDCDNSAPTADIEQTTTANQGLTYDAPSDQYNYVWKTNKSWSGTCRQLTLRLIMAPTTWRCSNSSKRCAVVAVRLAPGVRPVADPDLTGSLDLSGLSL